MTHEIGKFTHVHAPATAPEDDYSLPDALTIPQFDDIEESLAPIIEYDLTNDDLEL